MSFSLEFYTDLIPNTFGRYAIWRSDIVSVLNNRLYLTNQVWYKRHKAV